MFLLLLAAFRFVTVKRCLARCTGRGAFPPGNMMLDAVGAAAAAAAARFVVVAKAAAAIDFSQSTCSRPDLLSGSVIFAPVRENQRRGEDWVVS